MSFIENNFARLWNRWFGSERGSHDTSGLRIGNRITDGAYSSRTLVIPDALRTQHVIVLGRTGSGKSSLIRHLIRQDIESSTGLVHVDFHGDSTRSILQIIAAQERKQRIDLSHKLIVIEPADAEYAVGLNPLQNQAKTTAFVQVAEFAEILKKRWHMETFGARTEELLRNALHVITDSQLTLVELPHLLTNPLFRGSCMQRVGNPEVRAYFEDRYDQASDGMQAALRDPVLNKITAFISDPAFRHILGQQRSAFSIVECIDQGFWILFNLDKSRLGEQSLTLASMFLAHLKHALFARRSRTTFALYLDEVQNLVASDAGLETLLSESRKFGVQVCTANQFLDQVPAAMRAALLACGSHILFRLSSIDAEKIAAALDGGKPLQELLKNLPQREVIAKIGPSRWRQARVPRITEPAIDPTDLYQRSRHRWGRKRIEIEAEIRSRINTAPPAGPRREVLRGWE